MWWKVLGVCLVLLVVGAAAGWTLGRPASEVAGVISSAGPVPAESPAVPTPSTTTCFTDPADPALGTDLPSTERPLSTGRRGYAITLAVPDGWNVARIRQSQWVMTDTSTKNTYVMRVDIIADSLASVAVARDARLSALRDAASEGNLADLEVESTSGDAFVATYVQKGYCRVVQERFLSLGQSEAYVDLAVTGREEDRAGLMDLIARTADSMQIG